MRVGAVVIGAGFLLASAGCHLGPCATLSGQHRDIIVFANDTNATEFEACRQSNNCKPLCDTEFFATMGSSSGFVIDDCRRVTTDGSTTPDMLTLSITYHASTCD